MVPRSPRVPRRAAPFGVRADDAAEHEETSMEPTPTFPHHRLDAWVQARDLSTEVMVLSQRIPRGYRSLADQMKRAAMSTVLLIGEGANRTGAGEKRHRYSLARGECGELAAALELAVVWGLVPDSDVAPLLRRAARVGAMLTKLERRWARGG